MARIPVALQLYSVRHDCEKSLPRVLEEVARMGYEGVEFAGYYGYSAKELRKLLDDLGLKVAGTHTPLESLFGDELERTIEFNQILDNRYLVVPWMPESRRPDRRGWLECAQLFNELAEAVKPYGMRVGYHNHHFEFEPLEGEMPWDIFFGNTREDVVMQLDTGNALRGGAQAAPILEKYPGRALTVHLKEYSAADEKALIGEGEVPWEEVLRLCETVGGTQWYIIEQETYRYEPLECARRCLEALRAMGR